MTADDGAWETSVTELMSLFRESLTALVPVLERARIWPARYDDWDAITGALYRNIVIRSVEFSLPETPEDSLSVPKYEVSYPSYKDMSVIAVLHPSLAEGRLHVFHSFKTDGLPIESVTCIPVDGDGGPQSTVYVSCVDAKFRFHWRQPSGEFEILDALQVTL